MKSFVDPTPIYFQIHFLNDDPDAMSRHHSSAGDFLAINQTGRGTTPLKLRPSRPKSEGNLSVHSLKSKRASSFGVIFRRSIYSYLWYVLRYGSIFVLFPFEAGILRLSSVKNCEVVEQMLPLMLMSDWEHCQWLPSKWFKLSAKKWMTFLSHSYWFICLHSFYLLNTFMLQCDQNVLNVINKMLIDINLNYEIIIVKVQFSIWKSRVVPEAWAAWKRLVRNCLQGLQSVSWWW